MHKWILIILAVSLAACSKSEDGRGDGSQKFGMLSLFDPVLADPTLAGPIVPFPFDGMFSGFNDPTLNIPNAGAVPFVTAANLTDGFSTTASIFTDLVGFADYSTAAGAIVLINSSTGQILQPGVDFTVQPSTAIDGSAPQVPISDKRSRLLIEPLKPLAPSTTYLVAVTTALKSTDGLTAAASDLFKVVRSGTPVSEQDAPVLDVLSPIKLATLEVLRAQLIRPAVLGIMALTGLTEDDLVLAWSFTTQSTTKTLQKINDAATGQGFLNASIVGTTGSFGLQDTANVYIADLGVPYYLSNATGSPLLPLSDFWLADVTKPDLTATFLGLVPCGAFAIGATLPDGQTAVPSLSTTTCYPVPTQRSTEIIPVLLAVPKDVTMPEGGWPVVIFQHGITGNRTQMLAIAPALAAAGFATAAIDLPLHGVVPPESAETCGATSTNLLYNSTRERTFNLDLVSNTTGAPGSDGIVDCSGTHFINLSSLITSRDNLRQAVADLIYLVKSLPDTTFGEFDSNSIDPTRIYFVGHSLGGIVGTALLGVNTDIRAATLAMPGGGVAKLLDASKAFGPRIAAGLGASGVIEGTDTYETFLRFAQHLVDPGDPLNFAVAARDNHPIHMIEVIGDLVVPNAALATAGTATQDRTPISGFLSGTDPLYQLMGLDVVGPIDAPPAEQQILLDLSGLGVVVQFNAGDHGSILSPAASLAATVEMQTQVVNFLASDGVCLPVGGSCQ